MKPSATCRMHLAAITVLLAIAGTTSPTAAGTEHVTCANGLAYYKQTLPNPGGEGIVALRDKAGRTLYARTPPIFVLDRSMVQGATIGEIGVEVRGSDPPTLGIPSSYYALMLHLTPAATERLATVMREHLRASVLVVCDGEIRGGWELSGLLAALVEHGEISGGDFTTLLEARDVARALTTNVDEGKPDPVVTEDGIGMVALGDTLVELVKKLDWCQMSLLRSESKGQDIALVWVKCGTKVTARVALGREARVMWIELVGGSAKTPHGIGIGSDVTDVAKQLGDLAIESGKSFACFTSPRLRGMAFCIGEKEARRYQKESASGAARSEFRGQITAIRIYGESDSPIE